MPKVIRKGDTSSHGGEVVGSCSKYAFEGKLAARQGDAFFCPLHGMNAIAEGSSKYSIEGQPVARHGDKTQCGASLIASAEKYSFE